MVIFADTSALIKLFLQEPHTETMQQLAATAQLLCVCRITWAEALAGLAQRVRLKPVDADAAESARREIARHWPTFAVVDITQALVERAGNYAETLSLRGYDAIQLAAAKELAEHLDAPLNFACFDRKLNRAAQTLGMTVPFLDAV